MIQPLGVGIVGANLHRGWASATHLPALVGLDSYRLAAVSTTRIESATETAAAYGVAHAFDDARELIEDESVDVVVVCVKVPDHALVIRQALEAGKHVYCEWPLARNTTEATELLEAAERSGVRHAIGFQARSSPTIDYLRDLLVENRIGQVISATVYSPTLSGGKTRDLARKYTADSANGAGTLNINTGHVLDALGYVMGELRSFSATVETLFEHARVEETGEELVVTAPDQVVLGGRFVSGAVLSLHAHNGLRPNGVNFQARIFGTEGDLMLTSVGARGMQIEELTLSGCWNRNGPFEILEVPDSYTRVPPALRAQPVLNVAQALDRFAEAIRTDIPFSPDFATAVDRHRLIDAISDSARDGRRVQIREMDPCA